jgi:hypothetical protein
LGDGSGLSTSTVRLIERRLRGIESAWADWVRTHAGASGGVWKVRLSLDAEGKVVAAKLLVDGVGVPALAKSFEAQALNWRLPVGSGGASEIEFELHLSAGR